VRTAVITGLKKKSTEGGQVKIIIWHLKEMDRIIEDEGFEARKLSWQELGVKSVALYHYANTCPKKVQ
jgi:hypothetical protein